MIPISALLDLILAPTCLTCESLIDPADAARLLCKRCRARLRAIPEPSCQRCGAPLLRSGRTLATTCPECEHWPASVRFARSAWLLHPPADQVVHQVKYGGWHALAGVMAETMLRLRLPAELNNEVKRVIPVPTTETRLRSRGYNQAERLASAYARMRGWTLCDYLERPRASDTQTALQPLARSANVAGAFQLRPSATLHEGEHVLLMDDVLTTGATAVECARVLVAGGARCVSVLTFARAFDARRLIGA